MCHHQRMHSRWNRVVAAALLAMLTLAGCVRTDADLTVSRANTVSGTIYILGATVDDTPETQAAVAAQVTTIESRTLPGLRDQSGVTASAVSPEPGWFGTELVLDEVPIDKLMLGAAPLITRDDNEFVIAGVIDTTGQPDVPVPAAEGERPAGAAESTVKISLTFPGDVGEVGGSSDLAVVDGNTITWQTTYDAPLTLDATASATSSAFPPWIWRGLIWGVGGIVVLALAGLITVAFRSRHAG